MAIHCLIKDGVVVNTVVLAEGSDWTPPEGFVLGPEGGSIGDTWDGTTYTPPAPPPPSQKEYEDAIQAHVDATAKARGYRDGDALATYIFSTIQSWKSEAAIFIAWRDAVWSNAYTILGQVQAGQRTVPTIEGLIDELPDIAWPA